MKRKLADFGYTIALIALFLIGLLVGWGTWGIHTHPVLTIHGSRVVYVGAVTQDTLHGGSGPISIGGIPGSRKLPDNVDVGVRGSVLQVTGDYRGPVALEVRRGSSSAIWRGRVLQPKG